MIINDIFINVSCQQIVEELQSHMRANNLPYIQKIVPVPRENPKSLQINCPYHKGGTEHKPSAGIRTSDGMFHCFACGEVHSLPEVVSYCFGRNDAGIFGMSWIMRNFSIVEKEERKDVEIDVERPNLSRKSVILDSGIDSKFEWVTEEELDKYRYIHPYMYERKLTDEIIDLFDIGYDKDTDCITFPVRDISGRCLFVARRSVNTKYFHYPQGVEKPLYGLYEITRYYDSFSKDHSNAQCLDFDINSTRPIGVNFPNEIIICESMLDCTTCWVYGKPALALNGLGNSLQFKQLRELPCRELILATDNDEAGMKARERILENVPNKLITQYILPEGKKDINELNKQEFENLRKIF